MYRKSEAVRSVKKLTLKYSSECTQNRRHAAAAAALAAAEMLFAHLNYYKTYALYREPSGNLKRGTLQ